MVGRRVSLLVAAGFCAALTAGCSSSGTSSGAMHADSAQAGGGAAAPAPAQAPAQKADQPAIADRKLIRTANLELAAANVVDVTNRARDIAVTFGGFAGQEDVRGDEASITLHVPAAQFDRALGQLSGLVAIDKVRSRSENAQDVTEQLVDTDSRITTQRASVERVRGLLAKAQSVAEIVQIESELTKRESDLESLEKTHESLSGQVALAQVTVKVTKDVRPPPAVQQQDSGGFLAGLAGGWRAFLATGGVLLRVLGALLPFLVVLGIPGVIWARRWLRRRRAIAQPAQP